MKTIFSIDVHCKKIFSNDDAGRTQRWPKTFNKCMNIDGMMPVGLQVIPHDEANPTYIESVLFDIAKNNQIVRLDPINQPDHESFDAEIEKLKKSGWYENATG